MTEPDISADTVERLCQEILENCSGHPSAKIPWPHRILHEAVTALRALLAALTAERERVDEAEAPVRELTGALLDAGASLAAAISLLERGGKKAAASDKMFAQMLFDYRASLDRARAALNPKGADNEPRNN